MAVIGKLTATFLFYQLFGCQNKRHCCVNTNKSFLVLGKIMLGDILSSEAALVYRVLCYECNCIVSVPIVSVTVSELENVSHL